MCECGRGPVSSQSLTSGQQRQNDDPSTSSVDHNSACRSDTCSKSIAPPNTMCSAMCRTLAKRTRQFLLSCEQCITSEEEYDPDDRPPAKKKAMPVCWCARRSLSSFLSSLGGPFNDSNVPSGIAAVPPSSPTDKTPSPADVTPSIVCAKDGSSPTSESLGRPVSITVPGSPPGLVSPISVHTTTVQPGTPPSSAKTAPPGSPPLPAHIACHKAQLSCSPASSPSPLTKDVHLLPGGRRLGRARFGVGGLLESRRGSRTSLTLSLSPSVDSAIGKYPSPTKDARQEMEYLRVASRPMRLQQMASLLQNNATALFKEFWEIPMNHASKRDIPLPGIASKNRYQTIIPNDISRVVLPDIDNDPLSTYINANYVQGYHSSERAFIATQGPMAHTIVDFWRMVWHTNSLAIVMITNLVEKNKTKCERYIPEDNESKRYGPISVTVVDIEQREGYSVRRLLLEHSGETRDCIHYWYTSWPDHTTPSTAKQLLNLVHEVRRLRRQTASTVVESPMESHSQQQPVVVHCSAGLGRTGCFIALCNACDQLRRDKRVDILGIVCRMRLNRGGLVQTNEQYEFIHQALATYQDPVAASQDRSQSESEPEEGVEAVEEKRDVSESSPVLPPPPEPLLPLLPVEETGRSSEMEEMERDDLSECGDLVRTADADLQAAAAATKGRATVRESPT